MKSFTESGLRLPLAMMAIILPSAVYVRKPVGLRPNKSLFSPLPVPSVADTNFQVPTRVVIRLSSTGRTYKHRSQDRPSRLPHGAALDALHVALALQNRINKNAGRMHLIR